MKTVTLIDDDPGILDAVGMLLTTKGFAVDCYPSADAFLAAPASDGCIVSDLRMSGLSGMELLAALQRSRDLRPVILLTAHGDVDLAVRALKRGAFDFIEKPFEEDRLLQAVAAALEAGEAIAARSVELAELKRRYASLTERQKEVMWLVASGHSNKEVASQLRISVRTVETYRAWVLEKMQSKTLVDLVRASIALRDCLDDASDQCSGRG